MKWPVFLVAVIWAGPVHSQAVAGKIYYRQVLNLDPEVAVPRGRGIRAILYFSDTASYYVYNSLETAREDKAEEDDEAANIYGIGIKDITGEVFMTNFVTRKIYMREFVWKKPYTATDTLTTINWSISGEKKTIGRFDCQKAVANFRGRKYEAWFTAGIPVRAGPWKLQGLPGLILEAHDDKDQVRYLFEGLELADKKIYTLKVPRNGKPVTIYKYRTLWADETEKYKKYLLTTMDKGATIDIQLRYFPIEKTYSGGNR